MIRMNIIEKDTNFDILCLAGHEPFAVPSGTAGYSPDTPQLVIPHRVFRAAASRRSLAMREAFRSAKTRYELICAAREHLRDAEGRDFDFDDL